MKYLEIWGGEGSNAIAHPPKQLFYPGKLFLIVRKSTRELFLEVGNPILKSGKQQK